MNSNTVDGDTRKPLMIAKDFIPGGVIQQPIRNQSTAQLYDHQNYIIQQPPIFYPQNIITSNVQNKKQESLEPISNHQLDLKESINMYPNLVNHEYFQKKEWIRLAERRYKFLQDVPQRYNNRQSTNNNNNNNRKYPAIVNQSLNCSNMNQVQQQRNIVDRNSGVQQRNIIDRDSRVQQRNYNDNDSGIQQSNIVPRNTVQQINIMERDLENKVSVSISSVNPLTQNQNQINQLLTQLHSSNINQIVENLVQIVNINQDLLIDHLVNQIIEKARVQPSLYADLCVLLTQEQRLTRFQNQKGYSVFKPILLDKVQDMVEDINLPITNANLNEQQILLNARKNKLISNIRFVGELFLKRLLPSIAFNIVIQELIAEYLSGIQGNNGNEDSIIGLVELIDHIGGVYDQIQLAEFFNGEGKDYKTTKSFFNSEGMQQLSEDAVFQILNLLRTQYHISKRVSFLIENLQERRRTGWNQQNSQSREGAKLNRQLIQERQFQEDEKLNSYSQSSRQQYQGNPRGGSRQYQRSQQQQKQQYQQQENNYKDLVEMSQFIEETFKMEPETQCDKLLNELKTILDDKEGQVKFFEVFFKQILKPKKSNIDRLSTVYRLISNTQGLSERSLRDGLQKALYTDFIYDICESPAAKEVFIDILMAFINEEDYQSLNKLYLRPIEDIEEYQDFLGSIIQSLITQVPNSRDPLVQYTRSLKFDFEFE